MSSSSSSSKANAKSSPEDDELKKYTGPDGRIDPKLIQAEMKKQLGTLDWYYHCLTDGTMDFVGQKRAFDIQSYMINGGGEMIY